MPYEVFVGVAEDVVVVGAVLRPHRGRPRLRFRVHACGPWLRVSLRNLVGVSAGTSRRRLQPLVGQPTGVYGNRVTFTIELEREDDGRWLAEVPALPGVLCYGADRTEAVAKVQALALRVIAERLEHRETPGDFLNVTFNAA